MVFILYYKNYLENLLAMLSFDSHKWNFYCIVRGEPELDGKTMASPFVTGPCSIRIQRPHHESLLSNWELGEVSGGWLKARSRVTSKVWGLRKETSRNDISCKGGGIGINILQEQHKSAFCSGITWAAWETFEVSSNHITEHQDREEDRFWDTKTIRCYLEPGECECLGVSVEKEH